MSVSEKIAKKKIAEGKAASRRADKKKEQNKTQKAADTILVKAAANIVPVAGDATTFVKKVLAYDEVNKKLRELNVAKRGIRGDFKGMKVNMRAFDEMMRERAMEPEDRKAFQADVAIYTGWVAMPLSLEQQKTVADIQQRREDARKITLQTNGGDSGKEVGSSKVEKTDALGTALETAENEGMPPANEDTPMAKPKFLEKMEMDDKLRQAAH